MLYLNDASDTFKVKVLVQFSQPDGSIKQGDFMATFSRTDPEKVQQMIDDSVPNIDMLFGYEGETKKVDGVLLSVEGIGRTPSDPLQPAEALAFVKKTPECVNACAFAFLKATRPERYIEETSKKRRSRG